ncbi:MAG: extracellular solute-binding protein [Deltaproteobacteria bacterium]|nr:extracellular solute-binding protein [Deltaproteobacteria bacterium]
MLKLKRAGKGDAVRIFRFMPRMLLILPAVLMAFGCGEKKPKQPVLKVSFSLTESEWDVFRKKVIPPFEEKHGCKIEAVQIDAADLPKLLLLGKRAGESKVDLFAQDNMELAVLVKNGLVEDMSDLVRQYRNVVYPSLLEIGRFADAYYFIPFRTNVQIFYYNKAVFDRYGLSPPRSWDEWLKIAEFFYEKEKVGRILITGVGGNPTVTQMYEYIVAAGGDPFVFNDGGTKKTFLFFQRLWKAASPDSRKAKWDTSNDYFARDSVYLMQNWTFGYKIITEQYGKQDVEVYHGFPGPVREAHVIGGDVFGIPAGSQNKVLALNFIEYMLSRDVQAVFVKDLAWPSVRSDAYNDASSGPAFKAIQDALHYGVFRKNVPYWSEYQKLFEEAFLRIVVNGESIDILESLQTRMKHITQKHPS